MSLFKKSKVADFFLSEAHPYSKKRSIKGWHVLFVFGVSAVLVMVIGTFLDDKSQHDRAAAQAAKEADRNAGPQAGNRPTSTPDQSFLDLHSGSGKSVSRAQRQNTASQIIKRGGSSADVLPMGTLVRVRLLGQVESTDTNSPVQAVVLDDALSPAQAMVIPKGTKVIGNGQLDQQRERLQVRFSTLVFPEGEQYSISGLAAMPDGTSGLVGDYSSGMFRKQASQFIGNFVGGLAEGMQDRTAVGQIGIPFEPGSLKNGALNGVAQSSLGYAKSSSDEMGSKSMASIKVSNGKEFVLYLDREFHQ